MTTHKKAAGESGSIAKQSVMPIIAQNDNNAQRIQLTVITSQRPNILTKTYSLNDNGELSSPNTVANMVEGMAQRLEVIDANDFASKLKQLSNNQALCYGLTGHDVIKLYSKKEYELRNQPDDAMPRKAELMTWPSGAGVFMKDYDPESGSEPLSQSELLDALSALIDGHDTSAHVWWNSSSSHIFNDGTENRGLRGQRVFTMVKDARDIPRAGKVLFKRSWLAGYGYIKINKTGNLLVRSIIDDSVWQTNRLDFASGANCIAPLEQRRGDPVVYEGELLDTAVALPDLTASEEKKFLQLVDKAKKEAEPERLEIREKYKNEQAHKIIAESGHEVTPEAIKKAKVIVQQALDNDILAADFRVTLDDGECVSVIDLLDNPDKYHGRLTLDPLEPEYNGGKVVGKLYLADGKPNLHSFAHGEKNYSLVRESPPRSYADILKDAGELTEEADAEAIQSLVLETLRLSVIERRKVFNAIKRTTKTPLGVMESVLKESKEDDNDDHLMLARKVINEIGKDNVIGALAHVWQWDQLGVWRKCEERTVRSWSQDTLADKEEVTKSLIDSVTDLIKTEVWQPNHQFDVGGDECVNTLNGEVSLIDGEWVLQPHNRQHYRTTQLPVEYNPLAEAPRFNQFLREIFPSEDGEKQAQALLEMMGYSLMAHCRHEKFIILVGNGANGKSVVLKVLEMLCGVDSVAGVQPSQFANTFQRAHLLNKLVNIVSEIEQGAVIDDAALKGITSGETTTVEHKHKDPFQMTPFATCWFGTNHMPHTRDFSDGLFRRALILKFDAVFKPELGNCDPFLLDKLAGEMQGILNMALEAYRLALVNGFTVPESSSLAADEWRLEADQVAQFIADDCSAGANAESIASELYAAYKSWATDNGVQRSLSMKSFRDRLTRLGYGNRRTSAARYVTGVSLRAGGGSDGQVVSGLLIIN